MNFMGFTWIYLNLLYLLISGIYWDSCLLGLLEKVELNEFNGIYLDLLKFTVVFHDLLELTGIYIVYIVSLCHN